MIKNGSPKSRASVPLRMIHSFSGFAESATLAMHTIALLYGTKVGPSLTYN